MVFTYQKNEQGDYLCSQCGFTSNRQNTMHYHLKRHEGHLPYQCKTCKKEFLQAATLAVHIAARHSNETSASFACPCCDFKCVSKSNRAIHFVRTHCAESYESFMKLAAKTPAPLEAGCEPTPLTCPTCQKGCKSKTAFLYHLASTRCLPLSDNQRTQLTELMV
jgi:hypothetical protein